MTIYQALNFGIRKLGENNWKSANLDSEILLVDILNNPVKISRRGVSKDTVNTHLFNRAFLYSKPEYKLNKSQITKFKRNIARRAKGEPVAYIIRHKKFYGLDFFVNKNVLIPRPETELIVENVLEQICRRARFYAHPKVNKIILIDVGTGSGCIPISILKNVDKYSCKDRAMPHFYKIFAIDISKPALSIARKNAKMYEVDKQIKFFYGNLLEPITSSRITNLGELGRKVFIITANLPYLSKKIYHQNYRNLRFEPKQAILAKKQGLEFYKKLLEQIKKLTAYCLPLTTYLEIDPSQSRLIKILIKKYFPKSKSKIKKDLSGLDRLVALELK